MDKQQTELFIQGVKDCIPTLLGYLSIGFAAGVVQAAAGLSLAEIALISLFLYAGSAQFIMAGMIIAGSSSPAIIITIFFVNLRHLLLSAALSPFFKQLSPFKNMLIGALLTDETFGVAINKASLQRKLHKSWMHGLNITAYLNWFTANMIGALLGEKITDPEQFGLDFALTAMFIGLLVLAMLSRKRLKLDFIVAVAAGLLVVGFSFLSSSSLGVIFATVTASTIGMVIEKWKLE